MAGTVFFCCTDHRRATLRATPDLNGIDFLEVDDLKPAELDADEAAEYASLPVKERDRLLWQRRLTVTFVNPLTNDHKAALSADHFRISGGDRPDSRNIALTAQPPGADAVVLKVSRSGDFSIYRLSLVTSAEDPSPPSVFDPLLSAVDFSFKVDCPTDFDCLPREVCLPELRPEIDLDYLARDYSTFRRFLLDRIGALDPEWHERHAPDVGVALVELMAYVGDYLAYRQDAVATEAYLGTARRRISVKRHARLVDYAMHDGCSARAWVQVLVDDAAPAAGVALPRVDPVTQVPTRFLTRVTGPPSMDLAASDQAIATERPEIFEPLADTRLYKRHNRLEFYTWGAEECCLPEGATRATLAGKIASLGVGDVLILEEELGAKSGKRADADPSHRHPVRLTEVSTGTDPLGGAPITRIAWGKADRLPFPLCVSARATDEQGAETVVTIGVAFGNVVLVDHGMTVVDELPEAVPPSTLDRYHQPADRCDPDDADPIAPRFAPILPRRPVSHTVPYDATAAAVAALRSDVRAAVPRVALRTATGDPWEARPDLLGSTATAPDFVVEVETDDETQLRFGDGRNGARPTAGTTFTATYRIGNGARGNVGAGAIAHVASATPLIVGVRNPLPATGGTDPESVEVVRRFAPVAFRTQERAVTANDYARMAERDERIQRAAGSFRWTGSWRTAFVTVDPLVDDEEAVDEDLGDAVTRQLERYRMAGVDVHVDTPRYVPLKVEMTVCVRRDYFRADVKHALLERFSSTAQPDGRRGIFHPDEFSFGQPVYLSKLYATASEVDGVESVEVTTFERQGTPDPGPLALGKLEFGRLEIARLDNDPSLPERGAFSLTMEGGK
jgi:uncharacterized phage protein gp47/JayE